MIIDVTEIVLTPGNNGDDCFGNGEHYDENGELIEICCDECDYYICCMTEDIGEKCVDCIDEECPRSKNTNKEDCS